MELVLSEGLCLRWKLGSKDRMVVGARKAGWTSTRPSWARCVHTGHFRRQKSLASRVGKRTQSTLKMLSCCELVSGWQACMVHDILFTWRSRSPNRSPGPSPTPS